MSEQTPLPASNLETNRDKVLRREVVKVSDGRLAEMQAQAISWEGISDYEYHWHWAAVINELIERRALSGDSPPVVETPKPSNERAGTFNCPVCGLDRPHHHPPGSTRWYEQHVPVFKSLMEGEWPIGASHNYNPMGDSVQFNDQRVQQMWRIYQRTVRDSVVETTCSCPSGDGSLRWPCPVHPPTRRCHCGKFAMHPDMALVTDSHGHDHVFDGMACDCEEEPACSAEQKHP